MFLVSLISKYFNFTAHAFVNLELFTIYSVEINVADVSFLKKKNVLTKMKNKLTWNVDPQCSHRLSTGGPETGWKIGLGLL